MKSFITSGPYFNCLLAWSGVSFSYSVMGVIVVFTGHGHSFQDSKRKHSLTVRSCTIMYQCPCCHTPFLPHSIVGWTVVCESGISWSYTHLLLYLIIPYGRIESSRRTCADVQFFLSLNFLHTKKKVDDDPGQPLNLNPFWTRLKNVQ